jgi:serine/threonine protein kinase/tetratricopeptide (TPR) repeat protein
MQEFKPNDTVCNRYKVLRKLGAGAMGSVYLCEDSVENHIKVALKILISDNLDAQDVWAKGEYEALTRLRHPNLARVYNFGRIGDSKDYFIVSEFIKGIDLYSATEYLHYDELVDIIVQICRALEYIHSQGYVHFDIKPDNILVTRYKTVGMREGSKVQYNETDVSANKSAVFAKPNVRLIDFGLAEKITGSFSFAIKGTLNYLAPEILNGQTPDKRADLYSLGVTLYQVTNRDLPFYQEMGNLGAPVPVTTRSELFGMHMKKHPEYLRTLIMKLLEEKPESRFQSAKEVTQFINKYSGYHFEVETAETQASYFYSSKLVGRRREINLLKEYHERVFYPHRWQEARLAGSPEESGAKAEALGSPPLEPMPKKESPDADKVDKAADDPFLEGSPAPKDDCPGLVLISGEMGSGKSRLLEEFQHYLKLNDLSLFAGNCYEGHQKAYQPIVEVLRQLIYSLGLKSEIFNKYGQDVLKLLPELREKPEEGDTSSESGFRPDSEKLYFIERISQLLIEAAQTTPYVLVINNLHWVDEASIDLLDNFLDRVAEARKLGETVKLLILASFRPEEPAPESMRELLEKRKESGQCREILVRRLKHEQIQEFLCSMLSFSEIPAEFVTKLEEKTGGNPLFLVETLKALQDDGIIRNAGGIWTIKATSYDRVEIPPRMEDLLEKRLERIDPKKRELLDILSVLDKPANPKFLQKMKRFAELPILVELRDLEQSGIVAKTFEGGKLHFQIAQPKVREILYAKIPPEKREKYHGEVGGAFLEVFRGKEEEILEELAYHYQQSDQTAKAIELAIKAGDRLKGIYANERAYDYYMYVLGKVEGDPAQFALWAETHEKLGDLCTTMGRYEMADKSHAALLEEEARKQLDSQRVVKIFLSRGRVFEIQGDYDLAIKCYKDARNYLANFKKSELVVERIRVFNSIGWVYVCMGKYEKAMAISLEALRVIESSPERIEHAMVYNTIGSANFFKGNFREAIEYHRRSLQIKENLENIPEITISLNNLGNAHLAGCEYGEAVENFRRALRTSEEIGDPYGRAMTLHNFACLYFSVGQPEKGWQSLEESLKLSKLYNMRYLNIQNYIVRGKALREQRDYAKAEGNFFRALTAFSKQGNRWGLCTVLLQIAELHRLGGNFKEARSMVVEARRYAEELDIHHLQVRCSIEDARLLRNEGEEGLKSACKLLEGAMALAEKCEHAELSQEVNFEMGETLVLMQRIAEASDYFKTADEKFDEVLDNLPAEFRQGYGARRKSGSARVRISKPSRSSKRLSSVTIRESLASEEIKGTISAEDSLRMVNDLMVAMGTGGSLKEFLAKMLDDFLVILKGDAAYLLLVQGDNLTVEVARAAGGKTPGDPEEIICLNLIEKVLESRSPLLLADIADDPVVASVLEAQKKAPTALAIVSFQACPGRQGVVYVINPHLPKGGSASNLWLLQPFLSLAPIAYHQLSTEPVSIS